MPWVTPDWKDFNKRSTNIHERLVIALGKSSIFLADMPSDLTRPDYFGQAYSVLAENSYYAMFRGNKRFFSKVFPPFFLSSLKAHDRLKNELTQLDDKTRLIISTEPIADLFEISGFAFLFSELDGNDFWAVVKKLWDNYLENIPSPDKFIEALFAISDLRSSFPAIKPRDTIRTDWRIKFGVRLQELGVHRDIVPPDFTSSEKKAGEHKSTIIRIVSRGIGSLLDAQDVFLVVYMIKRPEAAKLKLHRSAESFKEALDYQTRKAQDREKSDE